MNPLDQFLMECHAVRAGRIGEIAGLVQRSRDTGLTLERMELAAEAADVEMVRDGADFKIVPFSL